ncbi:PREDICTED: trihelix transcription factor GT-2-like [Nicotiana attenuata]|uniref:Trihelix transcription factor gt-2 n=1 Tax=Nicotiana attenuata TaxID=49451 RepID=A0A314LDF2_NICAT|nr:PREDICTED: trihelix transcription factor GT-2-like [Nicotiana attenuata]OIT39197.1 trihelix transcription factor gt-2 [Nicotiana attenuata]
MLGVSSGLMTTTSGGGGAASISAPPPQEAPESGGSSEGGGGGDVAAAGGFSEEGERNSGGNRWPRQETLALLRIRSEMDVVFRDSSLKGPLWEEVSRKLADLGYHRSAKKCKEKFENVYKYHRRTKDGRASKADGKTYRFFDQLAAFENTPSHTSLPPPPLAATPLTMAMPVRPNSSANPPIPMSQNTFTVSHNNAAAPTVNHPLNASSLPLSQPPPPTQPIITTLNQINRPQGNTSSLLSNSTSSSSTSSDEDIQKRHGKKRKWKDFFERLTKDVIEKQEELQNKFLETLEKRERERMVREETWRVQEMTRMNREHDLLVQERSMAAAKDATIIAFLQKMTEQKNTPIPNITNASLAQIQFQLSEKPQSAPPHSQPQNQTQQPKPAPAPAPAPPAPAPAPATIPAPAPATTPAPAIAVSLPMTIHAQVQTQAPSVPVAKTFEAPKTDNGGENLSPASSSRWPKEEIEALIRLRTSLDLKYQDNGPKGPLWEEISAGMRKLGYNRNAKRCKEKWENINKYFKKVKESNKKRPEDSKTCPYFHQLEALYKEKAKNEVVPNTGTGFGLKPESNNPMVPIMAEPEQQWPFPSNQPQQQQQQQQQGIMSNIIQDHDNESDSMEEDDYDDDEDEGNAYEIVTNKQPSSMAAATATAATTAV